VAQVVLEDVYKSYSAQQGERVNTAIAVVDPSLSAVQSEGLIQEKLPATAQVNVLRRINLTVQNGEFMVLVGPSGCGKSTLLRLIAGLETLTAGNIRVGERLVNDLPPKQRDIAMVFQSYALYPHMTVYDNLAFGLRRTRSLGLRGKSKPSLPSWAENVLVAGTRSLPKSLRYRSLREKAVEQRVNTVAQMLQIEPLLARLPKQLSGGQKQRVALGRAMARNPQVFLMDEPLSNLDAKLRAETRAQIVKLQRQLGTTTIYVTHDQTEAMTMGDRIAVMNAGQIQQIATPLELYNQPANRFVAEFIGSPPMNFLTLTVRPPLTLEHPQFQLSLPEQWGPLLQEYRGESLVLGIRPEHLSLTTPGPEALPVQVELVEALGNETYLSLTCPSPGLTEQSQLLNARIEPDQVVRVGDSLSLAVQREKVHLFDPSTGAALRPV
jgi:multiple sugar transport system ATP-binding protein